MRSFTERFDGVRLTSLRVPVSELERAWRDIAPELRAALEVSIERARRAHEAQIPIPRTVRFEGTSTVEQHYRPVERVGMYAPGGLAAYASSVVMNVVSAQVAGVPSIVVVSPPQRDTGKPAEAVLAACALLGIDEVYAMGGAQAIAALAYGWDADLHDDALTPVDVITGPGNRYVATAKRLVQYRVGIDSVAGPTEILVLADDSASADLIAADLVSQAEHDALASSILVTPSLELAREVGRLCATRATRTRNSERVLAALQGEQSALVVVDDLDQAIDFSNRYGPEHLQVMTRDPRALVGRLTNAGAIFLGAWSPVSLGDYCAGSNHVLPTGNACRHASGLSVLNFLRPVQVIEYDREGLTAVAESIEALARAEALPAHWEAVAARFTD